VQSFYKHWRSCHVNGSVFAGPPEHLPREDMIHAAPCACPSCGGALRRIGEDITETLDYVPGRFKVIRHVREKLSCRAWDTVVVAAAPDHAIARGRAGAGLLAHIVVSKYDDHQPLYRQAEIFAREGVELETSTLSGWVGATSAALAPLIDALAADVMGSDPLHVDDTPVPVLAPGAGKTKTGRLWTYVRDERPFNGDRPPPALFFYSPDRKGEHPRAHLKDFRRLSWRPHRALTYVIRSYALIPRARPIGADHPAGSPLAHLEGLTKIRRRLTSRGGRHHFFPRRSFSAALSRIASASIRQHPPASASIRFSRPFSSSSNRSRLASDTSSPPNLDFRL
jgi:transposase